MKWLFNLMTIAVCFTGLSQEQGPCTLDTSRSLHLMWNMDIADSGQIETLSLTYSRNTQTGQGTDPEECFYYYFDVKFVKSTGNLYACNTAWGETTGTESTNSYHLINMKKISQLSMSVYYVAEETGKKTFDLSKVELLKYIDLQNLQSLSINESNNLYDFPFIINLSSWPGYNMWSKTNELTELKISSTVNPDKKLVADIRPFRKLKRLEITEYMNDELLNYPDLESLTTTDAMSFFAQHLLELPVLKRFSPSVAYVECFWHDPGSTYAMQSFFINALPIASPSHPLHAMDSIIRTREGTGAMVLLSTDWKIPRHNQQPKDTLAAGTIVNGKPTGIWKFEIYHGHAQRSWVTYHYDYDQKEKIQFPVSGLWEYYFQNGQLAISGQFLEGKKDGLWKFYDLNGDIAAIRNFSKDEIKEPAINYPVAIRYEITEGELDRPRNIDQGWLYDKSLMRTAFDHPSFKIRRHNYRFNKQGNLERLKNGKVLSTIPLGSAKFCRLVQRMK